MNNISRKLIVFLSVIMVLPAFLSAQSIDFSTMEEGFESFSSDVADTLPFAATLGGNWNDATVRGLPHFGLGATFGFVSMPISAFDTLLESGALGSSVSLPSEVKDLGLGVPFPAYTIDGRVGLPIVPFDVGFKIGVLPADAAASLKDTTGVSADYVLIGANVRYPIIKQKLLIPSIAVSGGINHISGNIGMTMEGLGTSIDVSSITQNAGDSIDISDPEASFGWESTTVDFQVQVSENLLVFNLYGGAGYTYGFSSAGGGIVGSVTNGTDTLSDAELEKALEATGSDISLGENGFSIFSSANGGALHGFFGVGLNLFIVKLDFLGKYNLSTQQIGASINGRVQI